VPSSIYTRSLHDALPIFGLGKTSIKSSFFANSKISLDGAVTTSQFSCFSGDKGVVKAFNSSGVSRASTEIDITFIFLFLTNFSRSEEHTSELQSRFDLVC